MSAEEPIFVIQKHHATSLHYDFRLEVDGVLKSWAVPRGPSTDPRDKRLAMEVEDHSLEYADFEGMIEEGSYGAGPVIVWDNGTYESLNEDESMAEALQKGTARVWLHGHKLRGGYTVYPREVENTLVSHPAVREAAVVGVPDDILGEEVAAFVVGDVEPEELAAFVKERLAAYKYPHRIEVLDELPRGPTGKVLREALVVDLQ